MSLVTDYAVFFNIVQNAFDPPYELMLILPKYRDAIQFVHDQTVRWMNKVINSVMTNLSDQANP